MYQLAQISRQDVACFNRESSESRVPDVPLSVVEDVAHTCLLPLLFGLSRNLG